MAEIGTTYYFVILLWLAAFLVLLAQAWRGRAPVVGLGITYWLSLAAIHFLSGLIQLLPWHKSPERMETIAGFLLTGYCMAGLLIGNVVLAPLLFAWLPSGRRLASDLPPSRELAIQYLVLGLIVNFVLAGILHFVPSLAAVLSGGLAMATAGLCLWWWHSWRTGQSRQMWLMAGTSLIMPVSTVVIEGFLGHGLSVLISIGGFIGVFFKPRITLVLVAIGAGLVGLSLFPAYMKARIEIRRAISGGETLQQRFQVTYSSLEEHWGWFDSHEKSQLDAIEERLNQNVLLGLASHNLQNGNARFANGETLSDAFLALIPRIFWPNKPKWAGSGDLVSRFTGMRFAAGTSVGIGHVMELYVNFGETALLVGYIVIGIVLRLLDLTAGIYLTTGAANRFVFWFVIGQSLLAVGGNFAEMAGGLAGYAVLCAVINRFLANQRREMETPPQFMACIDTSDR
ncbi:MAG TPA: hypothetical protein VKU02_18050 [Gemmataceae bacterium]|nr:hypothetical protein [Gemmataceae bacterium]